jgi:mRNA-degrading endonuclease toxin of MazEF toxin-antitoxin module
MKTEIGLTLGHERSPNMLAGDIIRVDFGVPRRSEAGLVHYAVVLTANNILAAGPRTVQVVPLTTNAARGYPSELTLETQLPLVSTAQCHLITTIDLVAREDEVDYGNIGAQQLSQIRALVGALLDID